MEYLFENLVATPGQLWRNSETGTVLFIYKKDAGIGIEGVLCDGRRMRSEDVEKIIEHLPGWQCVYFK